MTTPEAEWVERHLGALVGIESEQELHGDRRPEAFAAWRRFFEGIAEERPLVLVFEDLHWADDGLLDFIDHLIDWAGGVPILVVCTARPELLARRAGWGGGKPNAATLSLSPLDDDQTARLLAALLERSVLPAETQTALLQRAGGNPLYAEEFVRMVTDRELVAGGEELPLPESVQGIVAARLDALPDEEKTLLQDAAVIGKVFWLGAAAGIGGLERAAAEESLHSLERKEFVRRERRPSVAGESEYAFLHLLVRDVAYSQIPRARRAEKHRLAGEWIERLGRPEDHAEMLAHHYSNALELARAAGADTAELEEPARRALHEAGDHAYALGSYQAARRFYAAAVEAWPENEPQSAELLIRYGRVLNSVALGSAPEVLTQAVDAALAAGDSGQAAEAQTLICEMYWLLGRRDSAFEHLRAAEALVEKEPSSYAKAYVMANVSRFWMLAGRSEDAIRVGQEALAMAEELGLDELRAEALTNIGTSRLWTGDTRGFEDLEQSIAIADAINSVQSARAYGNLASSLVDFGELDAGSRDAGRGTSSSRAIRPRRLAALAAGRACMAVRTGTAIGMTQPASSTSSSASSWSIPSGWRCLAAGSAAGSGSLEEIREARVKMPSGRSSSREWRRTLRCCGRRSRSLPAPSFPPTGSAPMTTSPRSLSEWEAQGCPLSSESDWTADAAVVLPLVGREAEFLAASGACEAALAVAAGGRCLRLGRPERCSGDLPRNRSRAGRSLRASAGRRQPRA